MTEVIFSIQNILQSIGISLVTAVLFFLCCLKPLSILQECGYKNKKFLRWYHRKENRQRSRYTLLFLLIGLSSAILGLCFSFLGKDWSWLFAYLPFIFFCLCYYIVDKNYALKVPTHETERLKRLSLVFFLCIFIIVLVFVILLDIAAYYIGNDLVTALRHLPLCLISLVLVFILLGANSIDGIYEKANNHKYVKIASELLSESKMIKIGITGSFAKTSVKNILKDILSVKYSVLATPASYNTPLGIAKTVNEQKGEFPQIFIAEMGARNIGDIQELCDIVKPDYTILTGICAQHLETFGTIENVIATKGEILKGIYKGTVIAYEENTKGLIDNCSLNKLIVGKDVVCKEIKESEQGTDFILNFGTESIQVHTILLGKHAADNIALAASMAKMLGLSLEEIKEGIEKVNYIPHRLQVIEANGVHIIDDSYNANSKGAEDAIEALKLFKGKKIIVTPGIVEMGILERETNAKLGEKLVSLDRIILVGDTLVGAIKEGYKEAGGNMSNLCSVFTLEEAKDILKQELKDGDTVLFLNDLPDIY